jgi:hypothetical protein
MRKKKGATKTKEKVDYVIVEKELEYMDPVLGLVKKIFPVRVYPPQPIPEQTKYELPDFLSEEPSDE